MAKKKKEITGKFRICLIVEEFVDTGDKIEVHSIGHYSEFCWHWSDVKKSISYFTKRLEGKIRSEPRHE